MSATLWAFKDGRGIVRVTPTDPAPAMGGRMKATIEIPGGFSMRDMRNHFDSSVATLAGATGDESYLELVLGDLDPSVLAAMMTQVPSE